METMTSGAVTHLSHSLGPALVISMGYIDLGKWLAAVEGGARFGYDLVLLVLFFNLTAILCQYLAACIGTVTGRDLAKICREEYSKSACFMLGAQSEFSLISSDMTRIIGIAHGLNLLLGVDFFVCMCFASGCAILLPFLVTASGTRLAEASYASLAGLALLFYVLGVLVSQPEIPLATNIFFPKLNSENIYLLMALLGANIMSHNFYVHSAMVHQQKRMANVPMDALFHDHFFAILFIFTGIFLVNYVLMNSAAVAFSSTEALLNSQDIYMLIDQIFGTPVAPMGFLLVLLFSSCITATTWNLGGFLILRHLFGSNISTWVHHLIVKVLTVVIVFFFAKSSGSEGIYQLLIFFQVVQAMLLPSSVIPLLRVASARSIMGTFRLSWYLEILALLVFLGVTASNIIFISEMLFGNSSWVQNIREGFGDTRMALYTALLVVGFMSICFTLYLVVTPLKSASISDLELWTLHSGKDQRELPEEIQDDIIDKVTNDDNHMHPVELPVESSVESQHEKLILESYIDQSVTVVDSDDRCKQSINELNVAFPAIVSNDHAEELISVCDADLENMDEVSSVHSLHSRDESSTETKDAVERDSEIRVATKENEEHINTKEYFMRSLSVSKVKELGASNVVKEKGLDYGSGSGSISKLSGLGRGTRVKVSGILNEFWEHLFDYHGKIKQEVNGRKFDVLLGLDLKVANSSMKVDAATQSYKDFLADTDRKTAVQPKSMDFNSPIQNKFSNIKSAYGIQIGSPSWSQSMRAFNTQGQSSSIGQFESSNRINSAINLPQYADNRDYQPATIHGYQLASYLKGINGGRSYFSSSMSIDPLVTYKSSASFSPNMRDSLLYANRLNELNLLGKTGLQSPTLSQVNRVQIEGNYFAPSLIESTENIGPSAYTKKYHSSPDVSALIAASRKALLNEATWGSPIGTKPSSVMVTSGQPQSLSLASRTDVPLAFDDFFSPQFQRDVFSHQSNINPDTRSLWSRQPFEQLYGKMDRDSAKGVEAAAEKRSSVSQELFSYLELESRLLQYLRFCIKELLKLDGSDWLFRQNGGCDEDLIDRLAETEKYLRGSDSTEMSQVYSGQHMNDGAGVPYTLKVPNCGDSCTWRASLIVSFGVWSIRRILELSPVESRPDLWGKYTYVLNRLQGILDLAFLKPRRTLTTCSCLEVPPKESDHFNQSQQAALFSKAGKPLKGSFTTTNMILDIIKDVELAVSGRKGRSGTAAGDIAFPKGKENLASVLKRYKRRLSNKSQGAQEGRQLILQGPS